MQAAQDSEDGRATSALHFDSLQQRADLSVLPVRADEGEASCDRQQPDRRRGRAQAPEAPPSQPPVRIRQPDMRGHDHQAENKPERGLVHPDGLNIPVCELRLRNPHNNREARGERLHEQLQAELLELFGRDFERQRSDRISRMRVI